MLFGRLMGWASRWPVIVICAALTLGFLLFFTTTERAAPAGTPGVVELELAFSEARFDDIVERWAKAGMLEVQRRNLWIDLLFPVAYSTLLFGLLAAVSVPSGSQPSRGHILLLSLPFAAGLLDWLENGVLLFLLEPGDGRSSLLIVLSCTVASVKWMLLVTSVIAIMAASVSRVLQSTE